MERRTELVYLFQTYLDGYLAARRESDRCLEWFQDSQSRSKNYASHTEKRKQLVAEAERYQKRGTESRKMADAAEKAFLELFLSFADESEQGAAIAAAREQGIKEGLQRGLEVASEILNDAAKRESLFEHFEPS